ncbi:ABC transporter substrate-binding protein [Vibrio tritonius]|uniref:ABC transporter substrate-binding protein n=1 Tax=Vibrio tritonius TaxID=1435069 RepID=UPI0009EBFDA5
MNRRSVSKLGWLAAVVLVALIAVNIKEDTIESSASDKVTAQNSVVRIGVSQTPLSSPLIVASNLGLFKLQGLNVTLIPCNGGVVCSNDMFKGEVDYATASESVAMFSSFKRNDFVLLSSFVSSDNDMKLLTLSSGRIKSVTGLKGKKVGVVKASSSEFYLDSVLIASGLNPADVERVYYAPDKMDQALFSHKVDAISVWEPWGYRTEMGANADVINLGLVGIYDLSFNLMTMRSYAEQHKEQHQKILAALHAAIIWINQYPDKAQQIIAADLGIRQHQLEWSWHDYSFRLSLGNALLANLELQARWAIDNKLVKGNMPDYRSFFDSQALSKVLQTEEPAK